MKFFEWLDQIGFLNLHSWDFLSRSLFCEYGRGFITKIILPHPIKTIKNVRRFLKQQQNNVVVSNTQPNNSLSIVGAGFCLKPMSPACLSGRANHDCFYFDHKLYLKDKPIPPACETCKIREIGLWSLSSGHCFYIMTSANDILHDMLLPGINEKTFSEGIFVLCRYSFEPFKIALHISGINGVLFPYEKNDCRDYTTWRAADIGFKNEQTVIGEASLQEIENLLKNKEEPNSLQREFIKRKNIYYIQ